MTTEQEERQHVIEVAKSWLRTPYHHEARLKGIGVDCGQLLAGVFEEAGMIPHIEFGHYSFDWAQHSHEETYLDFVHQYAHTIDHLPGPADLVLWRMGHSFSHGAIVVEWPHVIHAQLRIGCTMSDVDREARLLWVGHPGSEKPRDRTFHSIWPRDV